jgi:hypothetical protein
MAASYDVEPLQEQEPPTRFREVVLWVALYIGLLVLIGAVKMYLK